MRIIDFFKSFYFYITILFIIFFLGQIQSASARSRFFCESYFGKQSFLVKPLPQQGSAEFERLQEIIVESLQDPRKKFVHISFAEYFEKGFEQYFYEYYHEVHSVYESRSGEYSNVSRRFMFDASDKMPEDIVELMNLSFHLLNSALQTVANLKLSKHSKAEFRFFEEGKSYGPTPEWHIDGHLINGFFHFYGPGTEISPSAQLDYKDIGHGLDRIHDNYSDVIRMKPFDFIVFSGEMKSPIFFFQNSNNKSVEDQFLQLIPPLVHRSPSGKRARLMVVLRYLFD
jgi:hypothetical protein